MAEAPAAPGAAADGKILNNFKAHGSERPASDRDNRSRSSGPSGQGPPSPRPTPMATLFRPGFARRKTCAMHPGVRAKRPG